MAKAFTSMQIQQAIEKWNEAGNEFVSTDDKLTYLKRSYNTSSSIFSGHDLEYLKAYIDEVGEFPQNASNYMKWQKEHIKVLGEVNDHTIAAAQKQQALGKSMQATGGVLSQMKDNFKNFGATLKSSVISSIQNLGGQLVAALGNMAVMGAIQLLATGLDLIFNGAKYAKEEFAEVTGKLNENTEEYKNQTNSLEELVDQYSELKNNLDNENLTTSEVADTKQRLLNIQQQLVESYGAEQGDIDLVNGGYESQLTILKELNEEKTKLFLRDNRDNYIKAEDYLNKKLWLTSFLYTDDKEINDLFKSFNFSTPQNKEFDYKNAYNFYNSISDLLDSRQDLSGTYEELVLNLILKEIEKHIDIGQTTDYLDTKQYYDQVYASQASEKLKTGEIHDFSKDFEKGLKISKDFNQAIADNDYDTAAQLNQDWENYTKSVVGYIEKASPKVQSGFQTLFDTVDQAAFDKLQFFNQSLTKDYASLLNTIKGMHLTSDDIFNSLNVSEGIIAFQQISAAAENYSITTDELTAYLSSTGILQKTVNEQIAEGTKEYQKNAEAVSGLSSELEFVSQLSANPGSISIEDYQRLIGYSSDYASVLRVEADRMTVDRKKLTDLAKARAKDTSETLRSAKAQRQLDYRNQLKQLETLVSAYIDYRNVQQYKNAEVYNEIKSTYESLNSIQAQIQNYHLLEMQLLNTTSALQAYSKAKGQPSYGDNYETAEDAYSTMRRGFLSGFTGSTEVEAAIQALVPQEIIDQGMEEVWNYASETLSRYFTENDDEVLEKLQNFASDAVNAGLMQEVDGVFESTGKPLKDWAENLGLTVEDVIAILGKFEEVEYGPQFDFMSELIQHSSGSVDELETLEASLLMKKAELIKNGLFSGEDYEDWQWNWDQLKERSLETAKEIAQNIENLGNVQPNLELLKKEEEALAELYRNREEAQNEGDVGAFQNINQQIEETEGRIVDLKGRLEAPTEVEIQFAQERLQTQYDEMCAAYGINSDEAQNAKNKLDIIANFVSGQAEEDSASLSNQYEQIAASIENHPINISVNTMSAYMSIALLSGYLNNFILNNDGRTITIFQDHIVRTTHLPPTVTSPGGPAGASGIPGAARSMTALVGELGPELLVDPRTNHWRLVGQFGAEFTDLQKGDIVFDASQTQALLKNGSIASRGTAFTGPAMVSGSIGFHKYEDYISSGSSGSGSSGSASDSPSYDYDLPDYSTYFDDVSDSSGDLVENFKDLVDEMEIFISRLDQYISNLSSIQDLYQTYRNKNQIADELLKTTLGKVTALQKSYDQYMMQANAVDLSASWKQKIRDGAINLETVTDEDLKNQIDEFQKWYEKALDCNAEIISLQKNLRDLSNEKLSNIISDFDQVTDLQDAVISRQEALNSLIKAQGGKVSEETYQQMLASQAGISDYRQRELELLNQELDRMLSSGVIQKYTEDWYEWQSKIEDVTRSLYDSQASVLEYKESIRELRWEGFQKDLDRLEQEASGLSDILSLIDAQELDGKGNLTNAGKTVLGLYERQLANAKKQAAEYSRALEIIQEELANGNLTQEEYNDLLDEYSSAQQRAVSDTKSARDAILSLVKDGIQEETEAYKKLIDTKKKDLQATKEYEDYAKTLRNKSSEINAIKAQIAALSGDENNRAQIRRLNEDLKKLNEEYAETQKDHEYDLLLKSYDDAETLFEEEQQKRLDALDNDLNAQNEAISSALSTAKEHYDDIYTYLDQIAQVYGARLEENITSPWMDAASAAQSYAEAVEEITSKSHVDSSQIQIPETTGKDTVPVQEEQVDSLIPGALTTSAPSSGSRKVSETSGWIAYGDISEEVRLLQTALNALGYSCGDVDGDFGWRTLDAVKRFQADKGLIIDGLVGDETRGAFRNAGFAVGGVVQASRAYLNRLVQASGEDGVAFVKNGESILDVDTAAMFSKFTDALPRLNAMMAGASRPAQIQISYDSIIGNIETVSKDVIGDIDSIIQRSADLAVRDIRTNLKKLGVR